MKNTEKKKPVDFPPNEKQDTQIEYIFYFILETKIYVKSNTRVRPEWLSIPNWTIPTLQYFVLHWDKNTETKTKKEHEKKTSRRKYQYSCK